METPGDRFIKRGKQQLKDLSKSVFAIPLILALSCLVYYVMVAYFTTACFSNLVAPLVLLGLLWGSGIKSVKKLLKIGAIAYVFFSMILSVVVVTQLQHADPIEARNSSGTIVGTLEPWYVNKDVPFTFRLEANLNDSSIVIYEATVQLVGINTFDSTSDNMTMDPETPYVNNVTDVAMYNFTLTTTTRSPISQFIFHVNYNGSWIAIGDADDLGNVYFIQGPTFKDSWAVAGPVIVSALQIDLFYVLGPYLIILGMIWWTRRARRMREKQVEKWQAEHQKEEAEKPKTTTKVPSLDAAMGKVEEGFVCSECGADVPADATVCPKCGEKFD